MPVQLIFADPSSLTASQKVQSVAQASLTATPERMSEQNDLSNHVTLSAEKGLPLSGRFFTSFRMTG